MNKGKFPNKCPKCKSEDLSYEDIDNYKNSGLKQEIECNNCDSTFTEYFKSVGWD